MKLGFCLKVLLIIIVFGVAPVYVGCIRCPEEEEISINKADLWLFWFNSLESDQQYRDSIGIICTLSDSTFRYSYNDIQPITLIKSTYAWSCHTKFFLKNPIESIKVYTIYDISEAVESGADITDLVLFTSIYSFDYNKKLDITDLLLSINSQEYFHNPSIEFTCVLDTNVDADFARFELRIVLVGGESISTTTPLIRLVDR